IAAPQLLPSLELLGETQRSGRQDSDFMTQFSLPPENLLTLLVPTFFGDRRSVSYWGRWDLGEVCGFTGIAALALSALAIFGGRRQRFLWGAIALAGLVLAL